MSHSQANHKKLYKKTPTVEEAQERRRIKGFTIRKERRDALLASKRVCRGMSDTDDTGGTYHYDLAAAQRHYFDQLQQAISTLQQVSQPLEIRRAALASARECLCSDEPPIEAAIELGLVPLAIEFLQRPDHQAQVDAAWCITNLAATDAVHLTQALVPSLPILVSLLSSSLPELQEQCAWALGNIAGDNPMLRNAVVAAGAIPALMHLGISTSTRAALTFEGSLLSPSRKPRVAPCSLSQVGAPLLGESGALSPDAKVLSTVLFALCNLAKGDSEHHELLIRSGVVTFSLRLLLHPEARVVSEAAWTLAYLSSTGVRGCEPLFLHSYEQVFGTELPSSSLGTNGAWPESPVVVYLLLSLMDYIHHDTLVLPVLRTIGNIVCASSANVEALCSDARFMTLLANSLQYSMFVHVKYETAYILSNVAVSHRHVIVHSGLLVPLILQNFNDPSCTFMLRKELLYSIANIILDQQFLPLFVDDTTASTVLSLFHIPDNDVHRLALDYVEAVLSQFPNGPAFILRLDGIEAMETIQYRTLPELDSRISYLTDKYYSDIPDE